MIELRERERWLVHRNVTTTVDALLNGESCHAESRAPGRCTTVQVRPGEAGGLEYSFPPITPTTAALASIPDAMATAPAHVVVAAIERSPAQERTCMSPRTAHSTGPTPATKPCDPGLWGHLVHVSQLHMFPDVIDGLNDKPTDRVDGPTNGLIADAARLDAANAEMCAVFSITSASHVDDGSSVSDDIGGNNGNNGDGDSSDGSSGSDNDSGTGDAVDGSGNNDDGDADGDVSDDADADNSAANEAIVPASTTIARTAQGTANAPAAAQVGLSTASPSAIAHVGQSIEEVDDENGSGDSSDNTSTHGDDESDGSGDGNIDASGGGSSGGTNRYDGDSSGDPDNDGSNIDSSGDGGNGDCARNAPTTALTTTGCESCGATSPLQNQIRNLCRDCAARRQHRRSAHTLIRAVTR